MEELLGRIRAMYVSRFERWVESYRARSDCQLLLEPAWRSSDGGLARSGRLHTPKRIDLAVFTDGNATNVSVDSDQILRFDPLTLEVAGRLPIEIGPFPWDSCNLVLPASATNLEPLQRWFEDWFDCAGEDDLLEGQDWKFREVMHFMSDPQPGRDEVLINLDFGSAQPDAFITLFGVLADAGVSSAKIGG